MNESTGTTPPADPPPSTGQPRPGTDGFFDAVRGIGLVRTDDRWIGGVGGGLALRFGIDPLITRGLLAVSVLLGGLGLILYSLAWLLLPEQRDGRIHVQQLFRGDFDIAVLGGFAFFVAGISFPDRFLPGFWWWGDRGWHFPWGPVLWIGVIVLVVALIANQSGRGSKPGGPTSPTPSGGAPDTTGQATWTGQPDGPGHAASAHGASAYYTTPAHGTSAYYGASAPAASAARWYHPSTPVPPTPPVHHPRGPGSVTVGIVVALGLIVFAGLSYAHRNGWYDGPVLLTTGACVLVLMGLGIIVAGLRGRSSGVLGGLAITGVIVLVPLSLVLGFPWGWQWAGPSHGVVLGDVSETPTTVAVAEDGYSLGAGDARIDLTELPLDGPPIEVPVRVGAGDVRIILPEDGAYEAHLRVFAGEVDWLGQTVTRRAGGSGSTYQSDAVADGTPADIVLDVTVGAGSVTITEAP